MDCMRDGFEDGKLLGDRFETISPLNHGSFGMVFLAKDLKTNNDVAIKCLTKPGGADSNCPAAMAIDERSEELEIHSKLGGGHPNIVNLLHHWDTYSHQYLVLELCANGDLYEAIRLGRGPLETEHVRDFMLQLCNAVGYLHANGVYHRDIKPENIFLTSSGDMKLGDFGLATTETWSTEFAVGSDRYMAPEQFTSSVFGYGYSPEAADIWAIGVVLLNILFQRNPFALPTPEDKLYSDFAADRQNLFDVFPNMSQDTYGVLQHCLCIDPAYRSLAALCESLKSVISFTTDDEALDEFCTPAPVDFVPTATAGREPLRTPSISTATETNGDSFPWPSVLKTPQKAVRHLSTIRDEDDNMFPGSVKSEWHTYNDMDKASLSSNVDSGLGMSYKSTSSKPTTIGSLPISFRNFSTKLSSPYGKSCDGFSKSWSDLYDEDVEDAEVQQRYSVEAGMDIERVSTAKPDNVHTKALNLAKESDGRRSTTPRQGLSVLDANVRSASPLKPADNLGKSAPTPSKLSIIDKWAALGNWRNKQDNALTPTPQKRNVSEAFSFSPFGGSGKKSRSKSTSRTRAPSWRQTSLSRTIHPNSSDVWGRKDKEHAVAAAPPVPPMPANAKNLWSLSGNWRQPSSPPPPSRSPVACGQQLRNQNSLLDNKIQADFADDIGDLDFDVEWVGGADIRRLQL